MNILLPSWELNSLTHLARKFHAEANIGKEFDEAHFEHTIKSYHNAGILVALGMEGKSGYIGCIVGIIGTQMMTGTKLLEELFWYVEPEHRGGIGGISLLKDFEECAVERRCEGVVMAGLSTGNPKLHEYYGRQGFKHIESHYLKLF